MTGTDYPYIVAWGRMMGSYRYYVDAQIEQARKDNAPANAIYFDQLAKPNTWATYDDITNQATRKYIDDIMAGKAGGALV